jgi:hypothetical protein
MASLGEIKVIEYLLEERTRTGSVGTWFDRDYMTALIYGPTAPTEVGDHLGEILDSLAAQRVLIKSNRKYFLDDSTRARELLDEWEREWSGERGWLTATPGARLRLSALAEAPA